MAEAADSFLEEREELMVSPAGGKPTLRIARFLKPSVTSINKVSARPFSSQIRSFKYQKWPLKVSFHGWRCKKTGWKTWVESLHPSYHSTWKKAGIYDGIMASIYEIPRNDNLVYGVAAKWSPETNTFAFAWGEATITLEDVMVLGGFSVLGESVSAPLEEKEMVDTEERLIHERLETARSKAQKACQSAWMTRLMGTGSQIEHEAFLSLWLSRFVLPKKSNCTVEKHVFPIAIRLARGMPVAIAPAVLASIYRDLTLLKKAILTLTNMGNCEMKDHIFAMAILAPLRFVQVWVWERFPALRPNPKPIKLGDPRVARWHGTRGPRIENVSLVLNSDGANFEWRPYARAVHNWDFPRFYGDREEWVLMGSDVDQELLAFARFLRICKLVGVDDCMEWYFPHRVAMQFGMDQDLPGCVHLSIETPEIAWNHYSKLINCVKLYIPSRFFESDVTTRYSEWWTPSIKKEGNDSPVPPGFPPKHKKSVERGDSSDEDRITVREMLKSIRNLKTVRNNSVTPSLSSAKTEATRNDSLIKSVGNIMHDVGRSRKSMEDENECHGGRAAMARLKRAIEDAEDSNSRTTAMTEWSEEVNETNVGSPIMVGEPEKGIENASGNNVKSFAMMGGLEKAMEDANRTNQTRKRTGFGATEIPGLELEARICKLEKVVARLKAARFG